MKTYQIKKVVQISNLITDMSKRNATEKEIEYVAEYLDGVLNDELEFKNLNELGGFDYLINKYQPKEDRA